ncbi:hypothetical protein [Phyllobacterium ifriqiyense]|uniref:hypothetical protein n=1 Tax=Phyllobacterium ifriqiyense TaxID=314238 RepID=UPI0033995987
MPFRTPESSWKLGSSSYIHMDLGGIMNRLFTGVCWLAAAYFCFSFHTIAGFPPKEILNDGIFIYVILFSFFLLLPFAQTLEIGSFFKYSAKIAEIKTEVKEFKEEIRSLITLQNSLITNVSQNVSHNVNVTVPSLTQGRLAEEKLAELEQSNMPPGQQEHLPQQDNAIVSYIHQAGGDPTFALMILRRDLEVELRRVLNKEVVFRGVNAKPAEGSRFYSLRSLWKMFVEKYPDQRNSEPAFFYVVDVCNATTHGQSVPPEVAEEALSMGLRVLELFRAL